MQAHSNDDPTRITVAVLGTGIIGSAMARNLQRKGFRVRVWNRTRERAAPLAAGGIQVAQTPVDAVRDADVVITMLKDGHSVLSAMDAAAAGMRAGLLWLQMSTVGEAAAVALAELAQGRGLTYIDAPVLGTKAPAELGQLTVLASGTKEPDSLAATVFDAVGKRTVWLGEAPGAASRLKLVLNAWVLALNHGVAETLALAEALGVEQAVLADVLRGGVLNVPFFHAKAAAIDAGNFSPSFTVDNAIKDTELILSCARVHGLRLDLVEAGLRRFERAKGAGKGECDMAASFVASRAA